VPDLPPGRGSSFLITRHHPVPALFRVLVRLVSFPPLRGLPFPCMFIIVGRAYKRPCLTGISRVLPSLFPPCLQPSPSLVSLTFPMDPAFSHFYRTAPAGPVQFCRDHKIELFQNHVTVLPPRSPFDLHSSSALSVLLAHERFEINSIFPDPDQSWASFRH